MSKKKSIIEFDAGLWIVMLAFVITLVVVLVFFSEVQWYDECGNIKTGMYLWGATRVGIAYMMGLIVYMFGCGILEERGERSEKLIENLADKID